MKVSNTVEINARPGITLDSLREQGFTHIAVDSDGEAFAFQDEPTLPKNPPEGCDCYIWDVPDGAADIMELGFVTNAQAGSYMTYEQTLATLTEI